MASGDTSSIKPTSLDTSAFAKPADAQDHADKAAVHHSLLSDAYNYVTTHKKEVEVVVATTAVAGAAIALRHIMPAPVAEKIATSGASILERTLGITNAPNAILEMKVLDAPEKVESLIARLRRGETTSDILNVRDAKTGAPLKLLTGHSPIAQESALGADRIATCDLPAGCEPKGIFAEQKGKVFLSFDKPTQTLRFSETPEPLSQRFARFIKGDTEAAWVPLGPHPSSNFRALQADRAMMPTLENVNAASGQATNPAREIVANWESQQRIINRNADKQDYVSNLIRQEVLPELKNRGLISKEWKFVSTQIYSGSDRAGADAIFVHEGTGQAHLVDFSSSPFKRVRPVGESPDVRRAGITERSAADDKDLQGIRAEGFRDKKVAGVKTQGLIGFDNRWFDISGKLDVEIPEAAEFKKQLTDHLTDLSHAPAYFTAGKTPFAEIVTTAPEAQVKQLEALKKWSLNEAVKPDSLHPEGYREYAVSLDKSIDYIKAHFISVGDTKQFNTVVQQAADQTIFRWAIDKVGSSAATGEKAVAREATRRLSSVNQGDSNLKFVAEKSYFSFSHDGLTYSSDVMTGPDGVLDRSRRGLLQEGRVKKLFDDMNPKQKTGILARLGTPGKPATEERAVREINTILINHNNEIKAGGQLGVPRPGSIPPLIERIHERVQIQTVSTLTRPLDIPGAAAKLDPKNMPRMQ